ncbi:MULTISPECIES: carbohydrate ABC transporter permease [Micromonospora]|uniref:ABC transporter permease n=3 Tax=Micromonospora TaxID=1873 RepID=A0A9X0LBQ1_9ACTN|nr:MULTISPECIES: sugar ABC transporter permease [Micromonospora]AIS85820.1 binding-protein-dependent transport systems inner membrane component [Verrucosispora sp. MS100047]AEB44746.1 binding-protein-dependent transport systems inner membrane component [Micromonospora maris AB-18-032]KUJ44230.1 ABC transporter permease [Micromonospora maris]MBL6279301.1 sugar ABC transporter permease [Micromonospora fiedleri]RUL92073.1 sugar ABC transporter permease [Verrucosispora sp. FIM060022]
MSISTAPAAEPAAATTPPAPVRRTRRFRHAREWWLGALLVLPALALAFTFKLVPLVRGVTTSFESSSGFGDSSFAGFDNYTRMFDDPMVLASFRNALLVVATLPVWIVVPLVLAVLIHQRAPGWKFFRAVYFIPYTIAPIVVGIMFRQILAPDGPINALLRTVGLEPLALEWLNGRNSALFSLVAVALWSFFGLGVMTYLAGLATIPDEVLEAAYLDGAGFWRRLFSVVVPMLRPTVAYWSVLCASGVLIWLFPLIYALTQGGPGDATMLPEYLVFLTTFQFLDRGYGSAIGIALFVFVALISVFSVRHMFKEGTRKPR